MKCLIESLHKKDKEIQLVLHLIKSCENFNLTEKEALDLINRVLGKDISRRTYFNYKRKLFDKEIFHTLKNSIYDNQAIRCLILDLEETDEIESNKANNLISEQLPDRKDIFNSIEKQEAELAKSDKEIKSILSSFTLLYPWKIIPSCKISLTILV